MIDESGKTLVQFGLAKGHRAPRTLGIVLYESRLAQNLHVMAQGRLTHTEIELAALVHEAIKQGLNDGQAHGAAQRTHDLVKRYVAHLGVEHGSPLPGADIIVGARVDQGLLNDELDLQGLDDQSGSLAARTRGMGKSELIR